ncbi:MAG: URC4/urg3 family protein [Proteobacteria bacterium]|nr:URC4/urg3 family protein [Pseudomonadota bacterium]
MTVGPEQLGEAQRKAIAYLRSPQAIRERSGAIFDAGMRGDLAHFHIELDRLDTAARRVIATTRAAYPDLAIPYHSRWNHFRIGGVDRLAQLETHLRAMDAAERGRCLYDLVIASVLLDAGAGQRWTYRESATGQTFARSEGLAVASFQMFVQGALSSDPDRPLRADATQLQAMTPDRLARHFQVSDDNPLAGLSGRAALLQRLGQVVAQNRAIFASAAHPSASDQPPRVGGLFDYLTSRAERGTLPARTILAAVLDGLGPIWPGRTTIAGVDVGDVWHHPAAGGSGPSAGLVPFHKLSQWLTYSLIEPLEGAGVQVVDTEELTGLAEYRNGGLLVDTGLLIPKHPGVTKQAHLASSPIVVEWRALTIVLLDRLGEHIRLLLGKSSAELPLARILEGGTWSAGRQIAGELRPGGGPPIQINSDGTVF